MDGTSLDPGPQVVIAVAALATLITGAVLGAHGLRTGARRRAVSGACFAVASGLLFAFALRPDREGGPTEAVLVFDDRDQLTEASAGGLDADPVSLEDALGRLGKEVPSIRRVAVVELIHGGDADPEKPGAAEELVLYPIDQLRGPVPPEKIARLAVGSGDTLWTAIDRLLALLPQTELDERAVLVSYNGRGDWRRLTVARAAGSSDLQAPSPLAETLRGLRQARASLFVLRSEADVPELRLEAVVSDSELPVTADFAGHELTLKVAGTGEEQLRRLLVSRGIELRIQLDGESACQLTVDNADLRGWLEGSLHHQRSRFPLFTVPLYDIVRDSRCPLGDGLATGYHRLEARLANDDATFGRPAVHYVRAARPTTLVLHSGRGAEVEQRIEELRTSTLGTPARRGRLATVAVARLDEAGNPERLPAGELIRLREVVLVEPTVRQLWGLESSSVLRLEERLRNGLNLMVVSPEAPGPSETVPEWLPRAAIRSPRIAGRDATVKVDRRRRLFIVTESSRLSRLPEIDGNDAPRRQGGEIRAAAHRQLEALRALLELLDIPPDSLRLDADRRLQLPPGSLVGRFAGENVEVRMLQVTAAAPPSDLAAADLEPSRLEVKARAIFGLLDGRPESSRPPYLAAGTFAPNTLAVLFTIDMPQSPPGDWPMALEYRGSAGRPRAVREPFPVSWLAASAVKVLAVRLPISRQYRDSPSYRPPPGSPALPTLAEVLDDETGATPLMPPVYRTARPDPQLLDPPELAATVERWLRERPPGSLELRPLNGGRPGRTNAAGRAIDERITQLRDEAGYRWLADARRRAPLDQVVLDAPPSPTLDPPAATVSDRWPTRSSPAPNPAHRSLPAAVWQAWGTGQVIVLAYSPFDRDLWLAANGWARDGWGAQRLLDLLELTGETTPISDRRPIVQAVRELADGSTAIIDVWAPQAAGRLTKPAIPGASVELAGFDPVGQRYRFQVRAESSLNGCFPLLFEDLPGSAVGCSFGATSAGDLADVVYLDLEQSAEGDRTHLEALLRLAAYSGGQLLLIDDEHPLDRQLGRGGTRAGPLALGLALLLATLFSPLARRWSAVAHFLRRRRWRARRRGATSYDEGRYDVAAVLADWGYHPGDPHSTRVAGTPAAIKPYEAGDDLRSAETRSLVPFAAAGRRMGLPQVPPSVRQRHVPRSMESILLVDRSASLFIPARSPNTTKLECQEAAVELTARAIWRQAGSVRVTAGPRADSWGPRTSEDDATDLRRYLRAARRAGAGVLDELPRDLVPGHALHLFSDFLAISDDRLAELVRRCREQDVAVYAVLVRDPYEETLAALSYDVVQRRFVDRSDWSVAEIEAAYSRREATVREIVEGQTGRLIAALSTDTDAELYQKLVGSSR